MKRQRLVFLGCGAVTAQHSRTLGPLGEEVQCYYASRDAGRAASYEKRFRGAGSFGSYEAALADRSLQVALVATPPALHRDLVLRALWAGKHVIVEKPAFMHPRDFDAVERAQHQSGRRVFVAENYAYKPVAARLRRLIRNGDLGDVRFVSINATKRQRAQGWRADPSLAGGGALFEAGVHWVSFAANLGLDVRAVTGHPTTSSDSALVVFDYANGAVGTLAYSWELAAPLGGLRLSKMQGTLGAVTFESNGFAMAVSGRSPSVSVHFRDPLGYNAMWTDFLHALRTGAEPYFTLAMGRRDLRLLEDAGATEARLPEPFACT